MRNLTGKILVVLFADGSRTAVEAEEVEVRHPGLFEAKNTSIQIGIKKQPVVVVERHQATADELRQLNTQLRNQVAIDESRTGDGVIIVKREVLELAEPELRGHIFTPGRRLIEEPDVTGELIGMGKEKRSKR